MQLAVNVPTSAGDSVHSQLAFRDEISWDAQVEFTMAMEGLGFDGIAVPDHVVIGNGPTTGCFVMLAAIARETEDVYLYPKTVNNHFRNPALLAKQAATLDAVSDGRLKPGMDASWKESEARAYGYDWPDAPIRLQMLEESTRLLKRLWTEETASLDGDYYTLNEAMCQPHPVRDPHPPIMVDGGGGSFTLRITIQYADSWNFWEPPEVMQHRLGVLKRHCEGYGQPFEEIERSWFTRCLLREDEAELDTLLDEHFLRFKPENVVEGEFPLVGTPEQVHERLATFVEIGFDEVVVEFVDFPETTSVELFAEEAVPAFRWLAGQETRGRQRSGAAGKSPDNPTRPLRELFSVGVGVPRVLDRLDEFGVEGIVDLTEWRPTGYRSSSWGFSTRTLGILDELDFEWDSSRMATDFEPCRVREGWAAPAGAPFERGIETDIVEAPVSQQRDDFPAFAFNRKRGHANEKSVLRQWREQLDWMVDNVDDGVFVLTIHPQVIGQSHWLARLESFAEHVVDTPSIIFETVAEVADRFRSA